MIDTFAPPVVLLVEDDDELREATVQGLELAGFHTRAFAAAEDILGSLGPDLDGVIVSDIRLPRMDGLELLAQVRTTDPDLPVILVTGHGDVPMAVAALQQGAFDFLTKPFAIDHLSATIRRAVERRGLVVENRRLRAAASAGERESPLLGDSLVAHRLRDTIRQLAAADLDVLVEGETGTGKDLVAAMLHRQGPRRARPLVTVDCAALTEGSAELDLFGHAADTVAHTRLARDGLIVASHGGTLLLDGIEALSLPLQAKLSRVLEEREVVPVGAERAQLVNLRVVSTSTANLAAEVAAGRFRDDLYHRLARTRLPLPALRDRDNDLLVLFAAFMAEAEAQLGLNPKIISPEVRTHLLVHGWPGNIRELRNYALSVALGRDGAPAQGDKDLRRRVADFESAVITDALRATRGNVMQALDLLGIPRKTLYDKFARYGIDPSVFRHL